MAKPYKSDTIDLTIREIEIFHLPTKPLIKMNFIKKRKDFGRGLIFKLILF